LDAQLDKQRFIELHNAAFMLPKKFEFQPYRGDEVRRYNLLIQTTNKSVLIKTLINYTSLPHHLDMAEIQTF
jgi:hypothetical protein